MSTGGRWLPLRLQWLSEIHFTLEASMMHVTNYTLDTYIHPELSTFTSAEIPDLTAQFPQAPHWVGNHFLNSIFFGKFAPPVRQLVIGIVRRTHTAFAAYHRGRKAALDYLGSARSSRSVSTYFDALNHWEMFALTYVMVVDLYVKLGDGRKLFQKNDGSCSFRLYTIGNKVKHLSPDEYGPADTVPLWLSNVGLHSFGVRSANPILD
jgi:hypothetical protein